MPTSCCPTVNMHCTWLALSMNTYSVHTSVPPHVVAKSADAAEMRVPDGMECPGPGGGLLSCLQAAFHHHPSQDLPSPRARQCRHQKFLSRISQLRILYLATMRQIGGNNAPMAPRLRLQNCRGQDLRPVPMTEDPTTDGQVGLGATENSQLPTSRTNGGHPIRPQPQGWMNMDARH